MNLIRFILPLIALLFSANAYSCERCPTDLMLHAEEAARQASWVLVGTRTTPVKADEKTTRSELDFIEFKVERILKSAQGAKITSGQTIRINFMDGMCAYGFMIHHTDRVVIFANGPTNHQIYVGVNHGCAATHLPIGKGDILKLGEETLTLESFAKRLNNPSSK